MRLDTPDNAPIVFVLGDSIRGLAATAGMPAAVCRSCGAAAKCSSSRECSASRCHTRHKLVRFRSYSGSTGTNTVHRSGTRSASSHRGCRPAPTVRLSVRSELRISTIDPWKPGGKLAPELQTFRTRGQLAAVRFDDLTRDHQRNPRAVRSIPHCRQGVDRRASVTNRWKFPGPYPTPARPPNRRPTPRKRESYSPVQSLSPRS